MLTIYSDEHRLQDGKAELIDGQLQPCFEMPRRADMIRAAVEAANLGQIEAPEEFGTGPITAVHDAAFVAFLEAAWERWTAAGRGHDALPLNWAIRGMRAIVPETIDGQLSYFSFDAGTPVTSGTWRAARAATQVALTGAKRIGEGAGGAFALCRPPGHHAAADYYGGYCFLNNAAIAAQSLRDAGAGRVAILDIDYHHGNGTQSIFYSRDDVYFASLHADPKQEFPYFLGHADETGSGPGEGSNANFPMPWGTDFDLWGEALAEAIKRIDKFGADALVVSLGVDTFKDDPISRFRLESIDFSRAGQQIGTLRRPTLFVMEGGYAVDAIGLNTVNVLSGFEAAGG